ncbi:hypothetical protein [Xanthomonas melonis]|uniref:hypothetical protein n=1 Tax=Xanthomonas melonis TaxID=56456 RepID=UPI0011B09C2E|nr:hypothetical protein [Xanthomonas melonis]MCC4600469.1 hypothetical protein [Xanthomonas melonis]
MQYDNPAARLLAILEEGQKISINERCRNAWQSLLETESQPQLMSRLGKLMSLPQEIIDQTRELYPNQRPTWSHWSNQVNTAFAAQNINAEWNTFIRYIDSHTIDYLAISADLLQAKSTARQLNFDELLSTREMIDSLLQSVLESEISQGLKKFIVHHLRKILTSIEEFKITGSIPILDAVESTIGHAHLEKGFYEFLKDTELGRRILDTLAATANVVTVAVGIPQISQALLTIS